MTATHTPQAAPFGAWKSPISAAMVAEGARPLSQPRVRGGDIFWLEGRAAEGGRQTLMRLPDGGGAAQECTPAPFNVRTRVHGYGGAAYLLLEAGPGSGPEAGLIFSNFSDNRLYLLDGGAGAARAEAGPTPISGGGALRYADMVHDRLRGRLVGVREDHGSPDGTVTNTLCALALDGSGAERVLAQGSDFYAAPRISPDGSQLCWLSWNHPHMPWQSCVLWLAELQPDGGLGQPRKVAGGPGESVCQPEWSPSGTLVFVSDRSGWWNLYRLLNGEVLALHPMQAEFGCPHWVFGKSMYGFCAPNAICCAYIENGAGHLARINLANGALQPLPTGHTDIQDIALGDGFAALLAGAPTRALELVRLDLAGGPHGSDGSDGSGGFISVLARSVAAPPPEGYLSVPTAVSFPSADGRTAHAFHYPPQNRDHTGPAGAAPPLVVILHGGPTGMAASTLKLSTQYWTSRGFAVLDVNYGGSSGFGRAYMDALAGQWGVVDVEDCVAGARWMARHGLADPERLIIRGGSAGGFTALCALAFHDLFKAAACLYAVSDLKALDTDSHKFESHYNRFLIGPPEQAEALYRQRSPIHHADRIRCPTIFFQGMDDDVVPPPQSEAMVAALKAAGVPVAYLTFEGEGHGFRRAQTIERALEAEWQFYGKVLGLDLPPPAEPLRIDNL